MRTLIPYNNDPLRNMWRVMDNMRSLMQTGTDFEWLDEAETGRLALNVREDENDVIVETAIPGVKAEDIDLRVMGNVLTLSAESKYEHEEETEGWYRRELRFGKFARSVELPAEVDGDLAQAELEDGILSIRLPKTEASAIHKIAVKTKKLLKP